MLKRLPGCALVLVLALPCAHSVEVEAVVDDRRAAWRDFRAAFDAGRYTEALPLALEVARLVEAEQGAEALPLATPLTNLATTYYRLGQHGPAIDAYTRALAILDETAPRTDRRLLQPLHGLGASLHALDRNEEALAPLKRAVEISRSQDGLYNPGQLAALRRLVEVQVALGLLDEATQQQQYALTTAESAYGRDDLRVLPTLDEFARLQEDIGQYSNARVLHARAIALVERAAGPRSPLMVPALRGLARSYRQGFLQGSDDEQSAAGLALTPLESAAGLNRSYSGANPDGERALKFAAQILREAQPPAPRPLGEVLTDLGDWYLVLGAHQRALEQYREAWQSFAVAGSTQPLQAPRLIAWKPPPMSLARRREDAGDYVRQDVAVSLTVLPDGEARDATVVTPSVPESVSRPLVSALRRARWRPRFEEGRAVATSAVVHEETMLLRPPKE
jgi:tetratricopeptide (TPR) repeat protein